MCAIFVTFAAFIIYSKYKTTWTWREMPFFLSFALTGYHLRATTCWLQQFTSTLVDKCISQSASSLKVIHNSIFVLSQPGPIRSQKRLVWESSLPNSFNKIMAAVKREFGVRTYSELLTVLAANTTWVPDNAEGEWHFYQLLSCAKNISRLIICCLQHQLNYADLDEPIPLYQNCPKPTFLSG